jgi:hypothetical protein
MSRFAGLSTLALCAVLLATPAGAASINLGGSGGGLLGTGLLSGGTTSASVNTAGTGGLLDLGGGSSDTSATLTLGGDGTGSSNTLLDLFGNGGDAGNAQVNLGVAELGGADTGVGTSNVTLDLFGNSTGDDGGIGIGGGTPEGGNGGGSGLFGGGNGTTVASLSTSVNTKCFSPNPAQLATLANRHVYAPSTFNSWQGAATIKVIDAGICNAAAVNIAAQPNIGRLQTFIDANPGLRDQLAQWGHKPGDVIAIDRQGGTLIVYVA